MVDYLGYRAKMEVTTSSTNTFAQPEYDDMHPHGVIIFDPNHLPGWKSPNSRPVCAR